MRRSAPVLVGLALLVLMTLASLAARQSGVAAAEDRAPINEMCPVMPDQPSDPKITIEFEGRIVGFCCLRCRKMFREDPTPYLALLPGFEDRAAPVAGASPAAESGEPAGLARAVRFAGRFHPVLVHFPIALLMAAALAEVLRALLRRPELETAAGYALVLGTLGAVIAAALGWAQAAHGRWPGAEDTLELHRWTGTAVAALSVVALAMRGRYRRLLCTVALLTAAGLVALTGHLGGTLVFGPDHFTW